jgi:hypothetical protein
MGRNQVHELNRDHVAADAAVLLADLRIRLWDKFRSEFGTWKVRPLYAAVFGSAARGDGDESSDIDLFLVHPIFYGEPASKRAIQPTNPTVWAALGDGPLPVEDGGLDVVWERQLELLREAAERWSGNNLQIVDMSLDEWSKPARAHKALLANVQRDGIELYARGTRRRLAAGAHG